MNNDFPRIVTLLRKERGLSQKQAALELGVSQALLSHYEKGIRECGLDFVVKIADYYQVSCDYLLGRSLERTNSTVSYASDNAPVVAPIVTELKPEARRSSALIAMNKKLALNSLQIIFALLEEIDHKGLASEMSSYLMVTIYKMLRSIYSANFKNPQAMFSVIPELYTGLSAALQSIEESNINCLAQGKPLAGISGVESNTVPYLSPDVISKKFPDCAPSLYNLIRDTEEKMKKLM